MLTLSLRLSLRASPRCALPSPLWRALPLPLWYRLRVLLFLSLSSPAFSLAAPQETPEPPSFTLSEALFQGLPRRAVEVSTDPFYRAGALHAEGYSLRALFERELNAEQRAHPERYLVRFVCSDGYKTSFPFSTILDGEPVLADRLLSYADSEGTPLPLTPNQPWPTRQRGRSSAHAGPYYLLWHGERYGNLRRPWPYQLTRIDLLPVSHLSALEPPPLAEVGAGHQLYRTYCKSCHSVNLVGGQLGPELNVPQNILSYRDRARLFAFIRDPSSFRYGSKMPGTRHLNDAQVNQILDYLQAMAGRQVCDSAETCRALAGH